MLLWPHEEHLPALVRANLMRLRDTGPMRELEASRETWTFECLPWSVEPPLHLVLRNERFEPLELVIEGDGQWRSWRPLEVPRFAPAEPRY